MIKVNRFYPSKPFYEMTIEELKEFVELQKYKDNKIFAFYNHCYDRF